MDSEENYPISRHNNQCIGPCFEKDTWILHPVTLEYINNPDLDICPTNEWLDKDPVTGEFKISGHDACDNPIKKSDLTKRDKILNTLVPKIEFSCSHFLKMYYKIESFDESVLWIKNHPYSPINTKLRIMECALKQWGNTNTFSITNEMIEFYIQVIKQLWITDIYKVTNKYIYIEDGKIYFKKDIVEDNSSKVEKINFLIKKFIDHNIVHKFMISYFDNYKEEWKSVGAHNKLIKRDFVKYILKKIENIVYK